MSRLKLLHRESFHAQRNGLGFKNSEVIKGYSGTEQVGLDTPSLSGLPGAPLRPFRPDTGKPGSRDEPPGFRDSLENTSVKWKPNSLSFLYRSVSSTQTWTLFPARVEKKLLCLMHASRKTVGWA